MLSDDEVADRADEREAGSAGKVKEIVEKII